MIPPTSSPHLPRRTIFVNPRFQGAVALRFAAVVLAGGAVFAWSFHRDAGAALRIASLQGHYLFLSPQEIVGDALARHVLLLSAFVLAGSFLVLLLLARRIRRGVVRLVKSFRASMDGDFSSPTNADELSGITELGTQIDASRSRTLAAIRGIREEAEFLRSKPITDEEFARRWAGLKADIRKIAP